MEEFRDEMRYIYDLTPDSTVVDAGAHKGDFSREITKRYNCFVMGFEPIKMFWRQAITNQTWKTQILNHALGAQTVLMDFGVKGDMSGQFETQDPEQVSMLDVSCLDLMCPKIIHLMKINIEGGEYDLLDRIIALEMNYRIANIQIQFHTNVPDCVQRRENIQARLRETHHMTYNADFVWESWTRGS